MGDQQPSECVLVDVLVWDYGEAGVILQWIFLVSERSASQFHLFLRMEYTSAS